MLEMLPGSMLEAQPPQLAQLEVELINGAPLSPNTTETVTILHANGGRIGQYAAVTSNAMITPTLSYGPNDVFLSYSEYFLDYG